MATLDIGDVLLVTRVEMVQILCDKPKARNQHACYFRPAGELRHLIHAAMA
ncbi:MAG TPA: hypothetical protein VGN21_01835 [Stellaceae bacterium]|jgi:hypothetical protein